jgi:hypothetical protein
VEPDGSVAVAPDAVAVGVDAEKPGYGFVFGPPSLEPGVGVVAGVVVQLDEELVDEHLVGQVLGGGQAEELFAPGAFGGWGLVGGGGLESGSGQAEGPVPGLAAAAGVGEAESFEQSEVAELGEADLAGAYGGEHQSVDLVGGEDTVGVQEGE